MNTLRRLRNFWILGVATIILGCFSDAVAQVSYKVTDLGTLNNGNLGCAMDVNNHGWTEIMYGTLYPLSDSRFGTLVRHGSTPNSVLCAVTELFWCGALHAS